jgi:hypothetical protein
MYFVFFKEFFDADYFSDKANIRGGSRKFRKRGPGQFQQKPLY